MGLGESAPPAREPDQLEDVLQLALLPGIGPRLYSDLIETFGSARSVLHASEEQLCQVPRIGAKLARTILSASLHVDPKSVVEHCHRSELEIWTEGDAIYPRPLRRIPTAPPLLFARGKWLAADELAIGIVGTRHATPYGRQQAQRIAMGLARRGITIVSGLARGVDAAAHQGALEAGGRTIAVLGCGHDHLYPPEHAELARSIVSAGAVVSELPPWTHPKGPLFPQRNRLISGLSLGVLVVEAADRSGALVTARHAIEQGRDVYALPGSVASRVSHGCHELIREGARLIESADQIIDELGPLAEAIRPAEDSDQELRHPLELNLNEQERSVLDAIGTQATSIDAVVSRTQLAVPRVLSTISVLEMRRLVRRLSGQFVCRV